jgi:serine/threonine protein phosphatase PrpC
VPIGPPVSASLSARGGRAKNEDRCGEGGAGPRRIFVVADGLGGHAAGEVAAEAAVAALVGGFARAPALSAGGLRALFAAAHAAVREAERRDPRAFGCRTTAVALATDGERALWGHVGDSRLYHLRGGRVASQTADHSVPQALVQAGLLDPSGIRAHPDRNRLLRCLGGEGPWEPGLAPAPIELTDGDAFLLCTDGFWELVTEAEMEEALEGAADPSAWLRRLEALLLERARGEFDNYSATGVFFGAAGAEAARRSLDRGAPADRRGAGGRAAGARPARSVSSSAAIERTGRTATIPPLRAESLGGEGRGRRIGGRG